MDNLEILAIEIVFKRWLKATKQRGNDELFCCDGALYSTHNTNEREEKRYKLDGLVFERIELSEYGYPVIITSNDKEEETRHRLELDGTTHELKY